MSSVDGILGFLGFGDGTPSLGDGIGSCGASVDICQAVRDCSGNNPCEAAWQATYTYYADKQFDMAKWQSLLGLAYGYLQYKSADRTADRQYDIANRQMKIAEEEYARYKCIYVECEDRYSSEICAEALPDVDYNTHANRLERDVHKKFSLARSKLMRSRRKYCLPDTLMTMDQMERAEALAAVAARDTAYRYAESRQDFYEDRRHSRRMDIFTHGRNIMTGQNGTYAGAMGYATRAIGAQGQAKSSLYNTIFGVGQNMLNSYYATQISPFPYGSGYTGGGAMSSPGFVSGIPAG